MPVKTIDRIDCEAKIGENILFKSAIRGNSMPKDKKMEWKNTINLPDTAFPMKAQLSTREPAILQHWLETDLYHAILAKRANAPAYILHDGPPYANGNIHLGTTLNKVLKDFVVKSKSMAGFKAPYVPGWDCHGLPIEHKVDMQLGEKKAAMSLVQVRAECRQYAEKYLDLQRQDFIRLGVLGEWQKPYTTLDHEYEARIIRFFNTFVANDSVYRKKRPVYWCSSCRTALAEAEVEYHNHISPSIYVKFRLRERPAILAPFKDLPIDVLIWTTTPWTIPANLAIAVHPEYDYMLFKLKGEYFIAASRLVSVLADIAGAPCEKMSEFKGSELNGLHCTHPFYDRESLLINTDYVLLDQGTGCVHTAPGHGEDDYKAGIAHGLDIYSPVNPDGTFDDTTGPYQGQFIFKANKTITEDLRAKGRLFHDEAYEHSYPHCWRCKNPVIFRATEQWFISMDKAGLRHKALAAIKQTTWIPTWGEERIYNMIANRPDWCISRQRAWGVPLPVFFCSSCQTPFVNATAVENVAAIFANEGSDSWFTRPVGDFLPANAACSQCGNTLFEKGRDIVDVWFESGASHGVLQQYPDHAWPADMYLEGGDQYRGWFHSSLLVAINAMGRAPYKCVVTHGWVLDHDGRAMHKSLGNVIEPQPIIKDKGAEILRLWVAMVNFKEDVRLGNEILNRVVESYRKIRNTWRFMLGVLGDSNPALGIKRSFDPVADAVPDSELGAMDRYILHRHELLKEKILQAYTDFEYHAIFHAVSNFFTLDLSAFYLNVMKDNLYCNPLHSRSRRSAQTVIFTILNETLRLLAPIFSFTCEEAWEHVPAFPGKEPSIHLELFPAVHGERRNFADSARWDSLLELRDRVQKEIEDARNHKLIGDSLEAHVAITTSPAEAITLAGYGELFKDILVVSSLEIKTGDEWHVAVDKSSGQKCPRCWNRFTPPAGTDGQAELCPRCAHTVLEFNLDN
jgi:isoleucyl-tRNA synthetase